MRDNNKGFNLWGSIGTEAQEVLKEYRRELPALTWEEKNHLFAIKDLTNPELVKYLKIDKVFRGEYFHNLRMVQDIEATFKRNLERYLARAENIAMVKKQHDERVMQRKAELMKRYEISARCLKGRTSQGLAFVKKLPKEWFSEKAIS